MATVDGVVRDLIEKRVGEPVLALGRFNARFPEDRYLPPPFGVFVFWSRTFPRWLRQRKAVKLPRPAYLAVGETAVRVFSARFGRGTRLLGPFEVWRRSDITEATLKGNGFRVSFHPAARRELVDIEAVEPGPEAASVIRFLTGSTS